MKKIKLTIIFSSISILFSIIFITLNLIYKPIIVAEKIEYQEDLNERIEDMRYDNFVLPYESYADLLNQLELTYYDGSPVIFEAEVKQLGRNNYFQRENSGLIRYQDDEFRFRFDDYTSPVFYYPVTNGRLVDYYNRYYFTVNGEDIFHVSNIYYAKNDPGTLFDYSENDIQDYSNRYYDENIASLVFWINFLEISLYSVISLIAISVPLLGINIRRLVLYRGFPSIDEAAEYYNELQKLKKMKRLKNQKEKDIQKYQNNLKILEKLKEEFSDGTNTSDK